MCHPILDLYSHIPEVVSLLGQTFLTFLIVLYYMHTRSRKKEKKREEGRKKKERMHEIVGQNK